jgi:hypothetical protein
MSFVEKGGRGAGRSRKATSRSSLMLSTWYVRKGGGGKKPQKGCW